MAKDDIPGSFEQLVREMVEAELAAITARG